MHLTTDSLLFLIQMSEHNSLLCGGELYMTIFSSFSVNFPHSNDTILAINCPCIKLVHSSATNTTNWWSKRQFCSYCDSHYLSMHQTKALSELCQTITTIQRLSRKCTQKKKKNTLGPVVFVERRYMAEHSLKEFEELRVWVVSQHGHAPSLLHYSRCFSPVGYSIGILYTAKTKF